VRPPLHRLPPFVSIATWTVPTVVLWAVSIAATDDTIRIWKIGSPHTGDTPDATVPVALTQESTRRGLHISVEAFPAKGFAATFFDAVTRNAAPDVLVFNNFGVMDGITTRLGTFEGIGQEPDIRRDLIHVTGAFDDLLGPERGWTYLFSSSSNYQAARTLALRAPRCPSGSSEPSRQGELAEIVSKIATAYLEGDPIGLQTYTDPDRLPTVRSSPNNVRVGGARLCGTWGNDKLTFASLNASYDGEARIGHTLVLLILRKTLSQWRLLVAARDPISNSAFVNDVRSMNSLLESERPTPTFPLPATLLSPVDGQYPEASGGQRFGVFRWRASPSDDTVAEIVEFAYQDDARLFLRRPALAESRGQISAGQLWTTRSTWKWRVWSITRTGDVVFSDARTFPQ